MSNAAMLAAIKKKKQGDTVMGDHQDVSHSSQHADDNSKDLHGLVESLNPDEKDKLKTILNNDGKTEQNIAKGGASSEEHAKIAAAMPQENGMTDLEDKQDHDDDIAKSMLDSRHMSGTVTQAPPRNLSDRVKMSLASKLKQRGKI
ncbi:MAG: hypothetical protein V4440_12515 [Pseudomonadota bacterium]